MTTLHNPTSLPSLAFVCINNKAIGTLPLGNLLVFTKRKSPFRARLAREDRPARLRAEPIEVSYYSFRPSTFPNSGRVDYDALAMYEAEEARRSEEAASTVLTLNPRHKY